MQVAQFAATQGEDGEPVGEVDAVGVALDVNVVLPVCVEVEEEVGAAVDVMGIHPPAGVSSRPSPTPISMRAPVSE